MTKLSGAMRSRTMRASVAIGALVTGLETLGPGLAAVGVEPWWVVLGTCLLNMALRWVTTKSLNHRF